MGLLVMLVLLLALGVAAWLVGNDSRDGQDWKVDEELPTPGRRPVVCGGEHHPGRSASRAS
jgi:hypothetical protein